MAPQSLYDVPLTTIAGEQTTLAEHRGKALLIVNVASRCGFTNQYSGLERLQEKYAERGFTVLGFPCNQFGGQEPGSNAEIAEFCSTTHGVSFPMFDKVEVKGEQRHPLFALLSETADAEGNAGDVQWNFEKFLVSPQGEPLHRVRTRTEPEDASVIAMIEDTLPR